MRHTPNGPSSLRKRALCPASLREEHGLEDSGDDAYRDSGIVCHSAMECLIDGSPLPDLDADEYAMVKLAVERANLALAGDVIIPGTGTTKNGGVVLCEVSCDNLPYSMPGFPEIGTIDLAIWYKGSHILLLDWKFGGSFVDHPKWNYQMHGYVLGLWELLERVPVHVAIVQPQAGDYSLNPWIMEPSEEPVMLERLRRIVENAYHPEATHHVGQGCKFCKAAKAGTCPARLATFGAIAELGESWREKYAELDSVGQARILTAVRVMQSTADQIIDFAKTSIRSSGLVPRGWSATPAGKGYRLAPRPSQPSWPDDAPQIEI